MTPDEKLAAILAAVQTDPGNRGLARDPHDSLFTACPGAFAAACRSLAASRGPKVWVHTGFFIPSADPPAFETDGPLGAFFLYRAFEALGGRVAVCGEGPISKAVWAAQVFIDPHGYDDMDYWHPDHLVWVERAGPAADGRYYTMRGRDITEHHEWVSARYLPPESSRCPTIGIGDGGNEIGMGKIPHETIVKNIPNGDLIHCRVPTDHLIVAGVSNWGAYALAAGVYVLRGVKPPADLFDPDRERDILEVMVREGPLVDGVTGKQTATVDGLSWEEYARPLVRIREVLES
jgi:hypothetical protein